MGFSKLHSSLVNSSLWTEPDSTRILFITMLALCDRSGMVCGSKEGISRIANIRPDDIDDAWESLMTPDPDSSDRLRNPENEGRRVEEVAGGFRLLNYAYYRGLRNEDDRREQNRQAQERFQERQKAKLSHDKPGSATVSPDNPMQRQSAEAEASPSSSPSSKRKAKPRERPKSLAEYPELRPTAEDAEAEIAKKYPEYAGTDLGSVFVAHYEEAGWVKLNGKDIFNWKATLYRWIADRRAGKR